jgi:hypothetical protein
MSRLKNEYKDLVKKLGATGAGLNPAHIKVGSEIEGLIGEHAAAFTELQLLKPALGKIREDWPWWDELHSFWRELPNYNPVGIQSSEPGTDHAAEASNLFQTSSGASGDEGEDDGRSATSRARDELEHDGSEDYGRYSDVDEEEEEDLDVSCRLVNYLMTLLTMTRRTPRKAKRERNHGPPPPLHRLSFRRRKNPGPQRQGLQRVSVAVILVSRRLIARSRRRQ